MRLIIKKSFHSTQVQNMSRNLIKSDQFNLNVCLFIETILKLIPNTFFKYSYKK